MTFFFDNCVSPKLVQMLCALEVDAVALRDLFPPDADDIDWLPQLKDTGWILVTSDLRIQRTTVEAHALRECGVSALILKSFWMKKDKWGQAAWLIKHWRQMEDTVSRRSPPVHYLVERNGKLVQISL